MAKGGFRPNAGRPRLTEAEKDERLLARRLAKRVGYTKEAAEAEAKAVMAAKAAAKSAPAVAAKKAAKPKFARQKPPPVQAEPEQAAAPAQVEPEAAKPVQAEQPAAQPAQPGQEPTTDQIKERVAIESAEAGMTPLEYMLHVMRSGDVDPQRRDRMAIAAAPFFHARKEPVGQGKREAAGEAAKKAAGGKFGARPVPGSLKLISGG